MRKLAFAAAAGSLLCASSPGALARSLCMQPAPGAAEGTRYVQISPILYDAATSLPGESEILDPTGASYAVSSAAADPAGLSIPDIVKVRAGGERDLSFGGIGSVVAPSPPAGTQDAALTRDSSGNLVSAIIAGDGASLVLHRYSASGVFDTTYGTAGTLTIPFVQITGPWAIQAAPDGSVLIAAGVFPDDSSQGWEPVVLKVTPAGALDTSFGIGGFSYFYNGAFGPAGKATDLSIRPDGTILVGGRVGDNHTYDYFFVARLMADGALDTSFGTSGGMTTISFGNTIADGRKMAVQPDGRIVLAGGVGPQGGPDTGVIRLTATGLPDPSFNGTGARLLAGFHGYQVALQADDRILIAGTEATGPQMAGTVVARLTTSGQLDPTFGDQHSGLLALRVPGAASSSPSHITYSPETGIHVLVSGTDATGTVYTEYLARLSAGAGCR
jgi:uncharacterized delta-60 repeat protein